MGKSTSQILEIFNNTSFFSLLSDKQKEMVIDGSTIVRYQKKETVFKQNSFASHIFIVHSGLTKLYVEGENNRKLIVKIAKSGDLIGMTQLFGTQQFDFTAVALKDTVTLQIRIQTIQQILEKNNSFANHLLQWYCYNNEGSYHKIYTLGTKQMHGRLADIILELSEEKYKEDRVFHFLTRKDIGELAGMSTESAIRLLTEFKNDGLITTDGKGITINNRTLLERLSRIG